MPGTWLPESLGSSTCCLRVRMRTAPCMLTANAVHCLLCAPVCASSLSALRSRCGMRLACCLCQSRNGPPLPAQVRHPGAQRPEALLGPHD